MSILSIDYGRKKVGLALLNKNESEHIFILKPIDLNYKQEITIHELKKNFFIICKYLKKICLKNKVEKILVGIPLKSNYEESSFSIEVMKFKKFLTLFFKRSNLKIKPEVILIEETMTSYIASKIPLISTIQSRKKRKKIIDGASAKIILEEYLKNKSYTNKEA